MTTTARPRGAQTSGRSWPLKALGVFLLLVLVVYALIFFTGDRKAEPKLGIDLEGGTRITLVPQGEEPTQEQLNQARTILQNRVNGMGVSGADVVADGNTLVITVPGDDAGQARAVGQTSQLVFRPVAQPQMPDMAALPQTFTDIAERWVEADVISPEDAKTSADQLSAQLKQLGGEEIKAPEINAEPKPEPANSLEATERRQQTTEMLRKDRQSEDPTTQLAAMALIKCDGSVDPLAGTDDPAKPLVSCDASSGAPYLLAPSPELVGDNPDGERLTGAQIDTDRPIEGGLDSQTGQMQVGFAFGGAGADPWARLTQEYQQKQVAITLDSQIISAPRIQSPTPAGSATAITGDFSQKEAQDLANNLKYGALPLSFAGEDGQPGGTAETVPASLGEASLKAGLVAGLVGLAMIAVFVFAYYRLYGLISLFTLVCSGALVYGSLVLLGRWIGYSLDLSGIAGLVIGIGATADSFVVIYERIKDEVRDGHTFRSATHRGWHRARQTIVTGNMVTLIASVVIYFLAVGEVKGFAFTLGMTTVFDLVVTFLVTAPIMLLCSRKPFWARPAVNGMGKVFRLAADRRKAAATVNTPATGTATATTATATETADAGEAGRRQAGTATAVSQHTDADGDAPAQGAEPEDKEN